jgi:hypothetical protein
MRMIDYLIIYEGGLIFIQSEGIKNFFYFLRNMTIDSLIQHLILPATANIAVTALFSYSLIKRTPFHLSIRNWNYPLCYRTAAFACVIIQQIADFLFHVATEHRAVKSTSFISTLLIFIILTYASLYRYERFVHYRVNVKTYDRSTRLAAVHYLTNDPDLRCRAFCSQLVLLRSLLSTI